MEFSRQEYWSRLPFLFPGDLPNQGIEPAYHVSPPLAKRFFTSEPPEKCVMQSTEFPVSYTSLIMKTHQSFTSQYDK